MIKQDMDAINAGDESDHDLISTEMLEDIRDRSQTYPNVNIREARYKIRDHIRKRKPEWKGALKHTRNMGKGLHKVCSRVVKDILQELTPLGESGLQVSQFIQEPRNFFEVTKIIREHKETLAKGNSRRDK